MQGSQPIQWYDIEMPTSAVPLETNEYDDGCAVR